MTVFTHWILTVGFNLINHTKQPHQSFLPAYMSCLSANQQKQRTKRLHVKNNRISHSNNSSFLLLFVFYFLSWRLREKKSHIWIELSWCTFCRIELSSSGLSPMYSTQSLLHFQLSYLKLNRYILFLIIRLTYLFTDCALYYNMQKYMSTYSQVRPIHRGFC